MLTILLLFLKYLSGLLLLAAFINLITNPWDFNDLHNSNESYKSKVDDDDILFMDDDDDDD